jgi:hypothetical protein
VQTALIYPPALQYLMEDQTYHLVLAHLFPQQRYDSFVRTLKGYKILDNGAAEEQLVRGKSIIETAWTWEVDEIVVPDFPGAWRSTLEYAQDFKRFARPDFKYAGVAQGREIDEVLACIRGLSFLDYISVLMLPRSLCAEERTNRYYLAEALTEEFGSRFEAFHILGSSWWIREVVTLAELPQVRGIDTSMPVKMGLHCIDIATTSEHYNTFPTQGDYFDIESIDSEQEECIVRNARTFRSWAAAPLSPL